MELIRFKEIFEGLYQAPARTPDMGHYPMVYGFIILLFIGFNRVWHFLYIQTDSMLCSIFQVIRLSFVTTYWRYVNSLGINQGEKGFRPALCFIEETREYFAGKLRVGETMGGEEVGEVIRSFKKYLPVCVQEVILRGDGEFISWESVESAEEEGYQYIFGNKGCKPPF